MFELRVLTGLHRGAALPLNGLSCRIGSTDDADMVMYDPGIRKSHCLLEKQGEAWVLSALEGAVSDSEGHPVEASLILSPGTPFAAGVIWLCIVSAETPWQEDTETIDSDSMPEPTDEPSSAPPVDGLPETPRAEPKARLPLWAKCSYLLLIGLLVILIGSWLMQDSVAMPSAPPSDTRIPITSPDQSAAMLQTMLNDRDLGNVQVIQQPDRLILSGTLAEDQLPMINRMLVRFQQRYRVTQPIENHTQVRGDTLPFHITQVTSGAQANIVTSDGQRLFVGDEVKGLRLVGIDNHQIEFNGKQQIKVNW
ncbi:MULTISPECIES: FHA domain-containing protein [Lonsdalea]|uniref:EscD/YscD/HrpQ family type III secretion system inner membrane ring protein n=2 Tax=Lonsdalea TaxID=1082702 RepID=A0ACD1JGH9_9GAMM|nr:MULTISPECIES: FHA domain-containing protein [Lonsdalea]RAT16116.1 EscD/YscD/HrpQ family type III secretion system inner membrane ring protein [Lonsdalea quercina]RAT18127.1 EscD/YscD/HrpQ family type III secretion system inner membrane ring protein [Lonsdalea quercina]RAT21283.1 EscD/YscD/HrpQ family type III secretion system inner membrane ring protein [Lonsdalea populi]RAT22227.1 EscD/YscD/HrpQ family type III secretion system inner membrane ring protein [Lonsdalea populi]RAT25741.1 EscD/